MYLLGYFFLFRVVFKSPCSSGICSPRWVQMGSDASVFHAFVICLSPSSFTPRIYNFISLSECFHDPAFDWMAPSLFNLCPILTDPVSSFPLITPILFMQRYSACCWEHKSRILQDGLFYSRRWGFALLSVEAGVETHFFQKLVWFVHDFFHEEDGRETPPSLSCGHMSSDSGGGCDSLLMPHPTPLHLPSLASSGFTVTAHLGFPIRHRTAFSLPGSHLCPPLRCDGCGSAWAQCPCLRLDKCMVCFMLQRYPRSWDLSLFLPSHPLCVSLLGAMPL